MPPNRRTSTRLIVVSDLHLGGVAPTMMSRPDVLATFIERLPDRLADHAVLELVINGDFIDFLAIPPFFPWTQDPEQARAKLRQTLDGPCAPVFRALGRHLDGGHRLTLLLGNHDLELALPAVQRELEQALGADSHGLLWWLDSSAYRVGGALIEHGNRYDGANLNDWDGLRILRSAQSRGEAPPRELRPSIGSRIVERVVNPLKPRYPFIDLLQPQNAVVVLLLLAFEPALRWDLEKIGYALRGRYRQADNPDGLQPSRTYAVAASPTPDLDSASRQRLRAAFGQDYDTLMEAGGTAPVGAGDWLQLFLEDREQGLAALLARGEGLPADRLARVRAAMAGLIDPRLFHPDGDGGPQAQAAHRILRGGVQTVVMGHTHLARHHGSPERAHYINTGTWADLVRVPATALEHSPDGDAALRDFLIGLVEDRRRELHPSYADLRITADGAVEWAQLRTWQV